jgi:hypothetical protein
LVASDMRPLSVVENEGFQFLLETFDPRYQIPSCTHLSEEICPMIYNKVRSTIQEEISNAQHIALTSDTWTSRATENYMALTIHFVNDNWEIEQYTLQTKAFSESHTSENLAEALKLVVDEWDLKRNYLLPCISPDNASNIIKAVKIAQFEKHIPCFAHTLNLATK